MLPCIERKRLRDNYIVLDKIGSGGFGSVRQAIPLSGRLAEDDKENATGKHKRMVAVKTLHGRWDQEACVELREFRFLNNVPPTDSLVRAYEMVYEPFSERCHLVMEYMDETLAGLLMDSAVGRPTAQDLSSVAGQILRGLAFVHAYGYVHRDIKPENILVRIAPYGGCYNGNSHGNGYGDRARNVHCGGGSSINSSSSSSSSSVWRGLRVKLGDFGIARHYQETNDLTLYVSTRWYRAPEILFGSPAYSFPVDVWAFGTVIAEAANGDPLFPGDSQAEMRAMLQEALRPDSTCPMQPLIRHPSFRSAASFVESILQWDPLSRPTAAELLCHPFITLGGRRVMVPLGTKRRTL